VELPLELQLSLLSLLTGLPVPLGLLLALLAGQAKASSRVQDVSHERVTGLRAVLLCGTEHCRRLLVLPGLE
jgi:hypothetical protein